VTLEVANLHRVQESNASGQRCGRHLIAVEGPAVQTRTDMPAGLANLNDALRMLVAGQLRAGT
jgi:hypothetical protein